WVLAKILPLPRCTQTLSMTQYAPTARKPAQKITTSGPVQTATCTLTGRKNRKPHVQTSVHHHHRTSTQPLSPPLHRTRGTDPGHPVTPGGAGYRHRPRCDRDPAHHAITSRFFSGRNRFR